MRFKLLWVMLALAPAAFLSAPVEAQTDNRQYIVVYVEFLPAAATKGEQKLEQLAGLAHSSTGLVSFYVNQEIGRPNFYSLVEIWNDASAYQNFLASGRTQALLGAIQPLLEAPLDERPGNLVE